MNQFKQPTTMQAITAQAYGGPEVLTLNEIPIPVPGDDDVLVRVHAAAIHHGDCILLTGEPRFLRLMTGFGKPKQPVPGGDLAGIVEAIGKNVTRFAVGDAVFGGRDGFTDYGGALAAYCRVPENKLVKKPENISFEAAAGAGISGTTALAALEKGGVAEGQRVLVNGASGGVGTFAVQIAKARGAHVTAVAAGNKHDFLRKAGADECIDYKTEDYTQRSDKWDLLIDAACFRPIREGRRALQRDGQYVVVGGSDSAPFAAMGMSLWTKLSGGPRVFGLTSESSPELLGALAELLASRKIETTIDRVYPLARAAEAFAYAGEGHTKGKVVITI